MQNQNTKIDFIDFCAGIGGLPCQTFSAIGQRN